MRNRNVLLPIHKSSFAQFSYCLKYFQVKDLSSRKRKNRLQKDQKQMKTGEKISQFY